MTWTQPICANCYRMERGGTQPARLTSPCDERCCICGKPTLSGIYIRRDPATVPFPAQTS